MKTPNSVRASLALLGYSILTTLPLHAANVVWGGISGEYTTGSNWIGGTVPNTAGGDVAIINSSDVTYTPGGDFNISNGGGLTLNGGSWTQVGTDNYFQLGGSLTISGGTFNQGTSGHIIRTPSASITVSSGAAIFTGDLTYDPVNTGTVLLTGGTLSVGTEFKPVANFSIGSGNLVANEISFSDGPGSILFSGGTVTVNGASPDHGFYAGGAKGLNFSEGSSGTLFISNYSLANLTTDGFLTNGTIQYDGTADPSKFSLLETGGGVQITAVPEPALISMTSIILAGLIFSRRRFRPRVFALNRRSLSGG